MQTQFKARQSLADPNKQLFAERQKVLIVEDDPIAQTIWLSIISKIDSSAVIFWATSAEEAAQLMEVRIGLGDPVNFVVADIQLTGQLSGIDLWKSHGTLGVAFLFASSIDEAKFRTLARRRPTHATPHLVTKPLNTAECLEICSVLLKRQSQARGA